VAHGNLEDSEALGQAREDGFFNDGKLVELFFQQRKSGCAKSEFHARGQNLDGFGGVWLRVM
jgi:hypothetical protein